MIAWTSDDARYGGCGTPILEDEGNWLLPGETTVYLRPMPLSEEEKAGGK